MDELLLHFTGANPCWSRELLLLEGENDSGLDARLANLVEKGFLHEEGGLYWLSDAGEDLFKALARECYLDEQPGYRPDDPQRRLAITKIWLHLERCNRQAGGEKKYLFDLAIPVRPALRQAYDLAGGKLRWLWPESPEIMATEREFPRGRIESRSTDAVSPEKWRAWRHRLPADPEPLKADLLFLCHYDMAHYLGFPGHPNDPLKLVNTDRFCFVLNENPESCLDVLAKYHLWLHEMRHVAMPGYLDIDAQQQDSANWLVFVAQGEKEAIDLARSLARFGEALLRPAMPMELWTLSIENLEAAPAKKDVIWELLPFISHAVWPPRG